MATLICADPVGQHYVASQDAADALRYLLAHGCRIEMDACNFYYRSVVMMLPKGTSTLATMGSARYAPESDFDSMVLSALREYHWRVNRERGEADKEYREELSRREYDAAPLRCQCGKCRWSDVHQCWVWLMQTMPPPVVLRASGICSTCNTTLEVTP